MTVMLMRRVTIPKDLTSALVNLDLKETEKNAMVMTIFLDIKTTISDNSNEKLGPPLPPISMMGKWARFGFCGDSSLIRGEGGLISLFILSKIESRTIQMKN